MKADTAVLKQLAGQMKPVINRMMETREAVVQAGACLMEESIGSYFLPVLRSEAGRIEQLAGDIIQLRKALEEIAAEYEACENRILDHTDMEERGIFSWPVGVVELPRIRIRWEPVKPDVIPLHPWERWLYPTPWRPGLHVNYLRPRLWISPQWWPWYFNQDRGHDRNWTSRVLRPGKPAWGVIAVLY